MRISGWLEVDRYQGLDFSCVGVSSGLRVKRSVKVISHFLAVTATSDYYMSMDFFFFFFLTTGCNLSMSVSVTFLPPWSRDSLRALPAGWSVMQFPP